MKNVHTTVAVYKSHDAAIRATADLKAKGFNEDHISIIGKSNEADEQARTSPVMQVLNTTVPVGGILGGFLSVFTGLGLATIPGLGVLFVGGAMAGALGGLSVGLASSGAAGALSQSGINEQGLSHYENELKKGNFLLMFHHDDEKRMYEAKKFMNTETGMKEAQVHLNENLVPNTL